jgi:ABC-2 type transport system permease protein
MRYILRVIGEEYRAIFADSGVLLIFIGGLAIYTLMYPLPYSSEVMREVPVIAVDQDHSALSRKLLRWIEATEEVRLVEPTGNLAEAQRRVLDGAASGIVVIPKDFERDILRGKQAVVPVYSDACYFLTYRQAYTGVYKAAATLSAGIEIRRLTASGATEENARMARDPLPMDSRPLFNPAGGYATYVVPGVLILIMQQTLLIGIGMLGGTRNEEFRKAPAPAPGKRVSLLAVLLGRGFAYFSIYILYPLFYVFVVFRVYHLPRQGNLAEAMIFLVPFVLAVTYLGLAMNALLHSRELSIPVLIFTSVPALFLIGFAWPLEAIPAWLRNAGLLLPSTSGCAGFLRINQMGASLHEVRFEWFTLWGLCGLYFVLAWLTMQRRGVEGTGTG